MKSSRQTKILEIIQNNEIGTQEELQFKLLDEGFKVTQATISRDIRMLGITKISGKRNNTYYSVANESHNSSHFNKLLKLFREAILSVNSAENLIVVKTLSGSANTVALAIDQIGFQNMLGCIAGDDTIFIAVTSKSEVKPILDQINELMA